MTRYLLIFLLLTGCGRQVPSSTTAVTPDHASAPVVTTVVAPVDPNELNNDEWPDTDRTWTGFGPQ